MTNETNTPSAERVDIETLIAWQIGEAKNARVHENDHTVRRRDEVLAALREVESLRKRLDAEENAHAELQSRCYEGFPSASDGIFDEVKSLRREREELRRQLAACSSASMKHGEKILALQKQLSLQPIETAPRDAEDVLLTHIYSDGSRVDVVGYWSEPAKEWMIGTLHGNLPTHWMPLPAIDAAITGETK